MGLAAGVSRPEEVPVDERVIKRAWIGVLLGFGGFLLLCCIGLMVLLILLWRVVEGSPTIS